MAVAVPIIASFMSVSAGIAAGAATLTGFLSIAGGVLMGVGALTGKKDLLKIGGLISLAGAATGALSSASSSGASEASSAWGAEGSAAGSDAAQFGKYGLNQPTAALGDSADVLSTTAGASGNASAAAGLTDPSTSILGYARRVGDQAAGQTATAASSQAAPGVVSKYVADPVTAAGQSMTSTDMNSILQTAWDKTKALGSGLGDFARNNKELLQLGGGIVQGMYGPDAEHLSMQRDAAARRNANLNSPVRLGIRPLGQGV